MAPSPSVNRLIDKTGPIVGSHPDGNTTLRLNRFNPERNGAHSLVFGHSNIGKSHDTLLDINRALEYYDDLSVVVLDAAADYKSLTNMSYSSKTYRVDIDHHNPFNITSNNLSETLFKTTIENGVEFLCAVLQKHGIYVNSTTEQLLHEVVRETYRDSNIQPSRPIDPKSVPTLEDVIAIAESLANQSQVGQLDNIIIPLEDCWNTRTRVYDSSGFEKFGESTVTRFEVPHSDPSRYIGVLNEVFQYSERADERVLVVVDDAHILFSEHDSKVTSNYLKRLLEAGNRTDTSYQLVFKKPETAIEAFQPSWIQTNVGYSRVYATQNRQYRNLLGFDPEHHSFVEGTSATTESRSVVVLYEPNTLSQVPVCCFR